MRRAAVRAGIGPDVRAVAQSFADGTFALVREDLLAAFPGDQKGKMLQSAGLKTAGKFYAFATATDLMIKLPAPRVDELIRDGAGLACSPRPGTPMKQWVRIPAPDAATCRAYLIEARAFVAEGAGQR